MTKVTNDPIGMFQRTTLALAKQRSNNGRTDTSTKSSSSLSPIQDQISISSQAKTESVAQALTKGMSGKSFSSVKEYGAYFMQLYKQVKGGSSDS